VVNEGRDQDAVAVIQKAWAALDFPNAYRIYTPLIGPFNVVVQELEFKDLAARQAFWAAFFAMPEIAGLVEEWTQVRAPGGGAQIWNLV
jgi:hypothetical protein